MRAFLAAALVAVLLLAAPDAAQARPAEPGVHPEWGSTSAPDGVLRPGCHAHPYAYAVTPPEGDWQLETFVVGPGRRVVASGWFLTGDPLAGSATFGLCAADNRPGRYRIKALLSVQNGPVGYLEGWLPVSHFRLRAPHRHHG